MKTKDKLTYRDIDNLPEGNYEVIDGEVKELAPTGFEHGESELDLGTFLRSKLKGKGYVAVGEVGIVTSKNPLRIRSADVVYISKERSPEKPKGILTTAPDLVVEVVSPSNTYTEMEEKVYDYLSAGVDRVSLVDPHIKKASLFKRESMTAELYDFEDKFEILPELVINLSEVLS